jgi:hypoxanthine phosphoribosyltransferase
MIDVKRCNYICGQSSTDVMHGVKQIVNFLEIAGRNYLLITNTNSEEISKIHTLLKNYYTYNDIQEFENILNDKSKLFRVDLLIFDFWDLSFDSIHRYKKIIDKLNIDYIIVANNYWYKSTEGVNDYFLVRELKSNWTKLPPTDFVSEIRITDKINKWTSTLDELKLSYIRNKKLENLFKKLD